MIYQHEIIFNNDRHLTYSCSYLPAMEGHYSINVFFAGKEIAKSPFLVGVQGMAGDPTKVTTSGPGLIASGVMVKQTTFFEVHTKRMQFDFYNICLL